MSYVCFCRLEFSDSGEPEFMLLGRGTLEECERIFSIVPAVSYGGQRPVASASIRIADEAQLEMQPVSEEVR